MAQAERIIPRTMLAGQCWRLCRGSGGRHECGLGLNAIFSSSCFFSSVCRAHQGVDCSLSFVACGLLSSLGLTHFIIVLIILTTCFPLDIVFGVNV